jgi:hypothetical protein
MKTQPFYILKRAFDRAHANHATPQYLIQSYRWTGTTVDWATVPRDEAIKLPLKEAERIANLENAFLKPTVRVVIETA